MKKCRMAHEAIGPRAAKALHTQLLAKYKAKKEEAEKAASKAPPAVPAAAPK